MSTLLRIRGDEGLKIPAYTLIRTISEMVQIIIKRLQQITKSLSIVCAFIEAMGSDFFVMATIMQKNGGYAWTRK